LNKDEIQQILNDLKNLQNYEELSNYLEKLSVNCLEEIAEFYEREPYGLIRYILITRREKLNREFKWTDEKINRFLKINEQIMDAFNKADKEGKALLEILENRLKNNDPFLHDYLIKVKLRLFILEPDEETGELVERGEGIYWILYSTLPEKSILRYYIDTNDSFVKLYFDKKLNWNTEYFGDEFSKYYIGYGIHEILDHGTFAWEDILKINEIWAEVNVIYQHLIKNI
jgi:hypothetical protein